MITAEKIRIFSRYNGNSDGWARVQEPYEMTAMGDDNWVVINELLQCFAIERSGFADPKFRGPDCATAGLAGA